MTSPTLARSHHCSNRRRQNPESPRTMKWVSGHALRNRVTSSLISAAACLAPSILLGLKQHANIA
jgi:hypothetical protein